MIQVQSLRQIKSRIRSIENTKKLTRAMEMVSVAKLKRSELMLDGSLTYVSKVEALLKRVLLVSEIRANPFLKLREDKSRVALCLVTSDTGLCSTYNQNIIGAADKFIAQYGSNNVKLICVGRKGANYFKRKGLAITSIYAGYNGRYSDQLSQSILKELTGLFLSQEVGEVYFAYTSIQSASRYRQIVEKFLPLECSQAKIQDCIFEPDAVGVLRELVPEYIANKMKMVLLSAFTSEHQSRAISMGISTNNAKELLVALVLLRNKIRQTNITKEILEVISSAEALKG